MATISKKEVHKFLDKHPDIPFSAAEFEYSSYLESEAVEYANAISAKAFIRRELKQIKRKITGIRNSADAMDKRKNYEKRAGYLQRKYALFFLVLCNWLMKEYSNIWNEYFKSMLCLVIGFRGDVEMLSFLTKETERLERMYLQETYAQGPILAIQELAVRFLN